MNNIDHPAHYSWLRELAGIEPIDIARHLDFDTGNALKYLLRAGRKGSPEQATEDLQKAVWYINDRINLLSHGSN